MKIRVALIFATLIALHGCATLSEQECLTGDWYAIGYEDGVRGRGIDRIGKHRKACANHDITPDLQAYQAGRDDGLQVFCQPQSGFNVGQRGGSYSGICPADLEPDFVSAFQEGRHLYALRSQVNSTTREIDYRHSELHELEDELASVEAALVNDDTTSEERARLVADTKDLARRQGELENEILNLERDRAVFQDRLAHYLHSLTYDY